MARDYNLRYAKAQQFYGFETPSAVLTAVADFDNRNRNQVVQVALDFDSDTCQWGAVALWEDVNG